MKFQVIRPFSITINGRRTEYTMGMRISETIYRRLNKVQQSRFLPANKCKKDSWTTEEYIAVAKAYLKYGKNGYKNAIVDFRLVSDRHSDNAVKLATYSCAHLDTLSDVDGMKDHADELLQILNDLCPGRFTKTGKVENIQDQLDALLADIRA